MKRTVFEVLCGMAVLVLLVSFHHQISRLKIQNRDVARLEAIVTDAVATVDREGEVAAARNEVLGRLASRIEDIEARVVDATAKGRETETLRRELAETKRQTALFRSQVERDVQHARELVTTYQREIRAVEQRADAEVKDTRAQVDDLARRVLPDPGELSRHMLAPAVQLNGDDTVGSGTLVYSNVNPKNGQIESYLLTSYHVVRNILADTPSARRKGISVTIYTDEGKVEQFADMISHDERIDAALMKLRGKRRWATVARVLRRDEAQAARIWEAIYAVGCPLGNDPIPTAGAIASKSNELNGANYWMINAPTYFGNSGGAVYLARSRALVGVFSKIYTHGRSAPVVVPHMGLCTPITLIHDWLDRERLGFVLQTETARAAVPEIAAPAPMK